MAKPDEKHLRDLAKQLAIEELKFYARYLVGLPIVSAGVSAGLGFFGGLGWIAISIIASIVALAAALLVGIYILLHLLPLRNWAECTIITDLIGFEKRNVESAFMPSKILERDNISVLQVMGNGCSKWTIPIADAMAVKSFRQIRNGGGEIHFLASCPVYLSELDDRTKIKKAKRNATSLLKLFDFAEKSKAAGGTFEIRTYKHTATLRLIILNESECIVGHYQEDGNADSIDTPLLIFHHNHENKWGFGGAFRRVFESEWHRAQPPTPEEWRKMRELRDTPE